MQDKMSTEVKQQNDKQMQEELKENEKRELALLVELVRIYYDGP